MAPNLPRFSTVWKALYAHLWGWNSVLNEKVQVIKGLFVLIIDSFLLYGWYKHRSIAGNISFSQQQTLYQICTENE
jgi:hypothetical protein